MVVKFNARLSYFCPGNFISWVIHPVPGEKHPVIEEDYKLSGTDVAVMALDMDISQSSPFAMPKVSGADSLKNAVFEIEKTGRKQFRVVRHVGNLKVEYKIEPVANTTVPEARGNRFAEIDLDAGTRRFTEAMNRMGNTTKEQPVKSTTNSRFSDLDY